MCANGKRIHRNYSDKLYRAWRVDNKKIVSDSDSDTDLNSNNNNNSSSNDNKDEKMLVDKQTEYKIKQFMKHSQKKFGILIDFNESVMYPWHENKYVEQWKIEIPKLHDFNFHVWVYRANDQLLIYPPKKLKQKTIDQIDTYDW